MTAWRPARLTPIAAIGSIASSLLLGVGLSAVPGTADAQGATPAAGSAAAEPLAACGDGPSFPLAVLDGIQGAELAGDGAARRLAKAATTGEAGYVPRGGWMRVVTEPGRAVFATWLHLPRSAGGPLLQLTVESDAPGSADPDDWRIASAGFCWPRVVPPEGSATVPWTLEAPADREATSVRIVPAVPVCADPSPVVVLTPERVSVTVLAPIDGHGCVGPPDPTLEVELSEPLGPRELLDGAFDPPALVQPAPHATPVATPPIEPGSITVFFAARPLSIARSHAIADSLGSVPGLVEVDVVDQLAVSLLLASDRDLVLAGPPRLCLVGPFAAPDDAGLIDRCWGDPDLGAILARAMPHDASGRPMLPAGVAVEIPATITRGEVRCDYPPGEWHLEVVLTPLVDGHGWTDVALSEWTYPVDASGLQPVRELTRLESRYCGMATRPTPSGSIAP